MGNWLAWHAVWPKKAHFLPYFADFFDRSAATAYKNPRRLAKNGHFFVSDATTQKRHKLFTDMRVTPVVLLDQNFNAFYTIEKYTNLPIFTANIIGNGLGATTLTSYKKIKMEQYGKILLIAMPTFLVLVMMEKLYGVLRGRDTYRNMDLIASLSSGITNVVKDILGLSVSILAYGWLVSKVAVFHLESSVLIYAVAFVALDFSGYCSHRIAHSVNFFWNKHAIHHSSEDFNLACALRQSVSSFVNMFTIFLLPAAVLGVPGAVIGVVAPLHLFAQFWYHTQHIGKMGFLEHIIVTPSHHRVHHAINPAYIDKNHGQIFIFWDKLFGTFQAELPEMPPVFGVTRPVKTWNPIKINFQHLWLLVQDAWRAEAWRDKWRIWFMPTGWRPSDVASRYPLDTIEDIDQYKKYEPKTSNMLKGWSLIQMLATFIFVLYFFSNIALISTPGIYYYGAFIFLSVYAYTEIMDCNPMALFWELLKNGFGLAVVWQTGDWFGLEGLMSGGKGVVVGWFAVTSLVTAYFVFGEIRRSSRGEDGVVLWRL